MAKDTGFLAEFKQFIARGNVMDMAVGVIVGGAFKSIADTLTNGVLMPVISMLTGGVDFSDWKWVLKDAVVENGQEIAAAVSINYGSFLSAVLNFLIVAFAVFCTVKALNKLHRKKVEEPAAPPPPPEPTKEEILLTEIRDLLKEQSK